MGADAQARTLLQQTLRILAAPEGEFGHRVAALLQLLVSSLPIKDALLLLPGSTAEPGTRLYRAGSAIPQSAGGHHLPSFPGWHGGSDDLTLVLPTSSEEHCALLCLQGVAGHDALHPSYLELELIAQQFGQLLRQQQRAGSSYLQCSRFRFLAELTSAFNRAHTVKELLRELLRALVREGHVVAALVCHGRQDQLRAAPLCELSGGFRSQRERFVRIAQTQHPLALAQRQSLVVEHSGDEDGCDEAPPFWSLTIPLMFKNRHLGTLTVVGRQGRVELPLGTNERTRALISDVAAQTAEAWGRISALHRLEVVSRENDRKLHELSLLYSLAAAMHASRGLDELMHFILSLMVAEESIGCDHSALLMYSERSHFLQGMLGVGLDFGIQQWARGQSWQTRDISTPLIPVEIIERQKHSEFSRRVRQLRLELDGGEALGQALLRGQAVRIRADQVTEASLDALGLGHVLCLPVLGRQRPLAVLILGRDSARAGFDDSELRFLELFASQAGLAMENAMLVQQLKSTHAELQIASENLLQAEKLATIGEFAAGVAHELKNPLVCVGGFAQRLEKNVEPGTRAHEYASIISREVRRIEAMLSDILAFSRRQMMCFAPCNIIEVMSSAMTLMEREFADADIAITQSIEADLPPVLGDEVQLRQVFLNILANARDVMSGGGTLGVRAFLSTLRGDPALAVQIADTGGGIPPEVLRNIFNPFFTTKASGTGLGLPICHRIIEHHRGGIEVINEERGACFTILLPLSEQRAPHS